MSRRAPSKPTKKKPTARKKPKASPAAAKALELSPLDDLELDPYNPRLHDDEEGSSQPRLLEIMARRFKLDELADSILTSGFLPFDPIVGCTENDHVVVLEGNRRVATLKLLLDPELAPEKLKKKWKQYSKKLTPEVARQIERVLVTVFPSRENVDVTSYIAFRHVTGVLPWPSLEKASYIDRLVAERMSYDEIAQRLGSYPSYVERHYVAFRLVREAEAEGIAGHEEMESSFGVLLRALQASGVNEFLGITYTRDPSKGKKPVATNKIDDLRDFVRWTFGTDEKAPILGESRDLTKLGRVLASPEAVRYLRSSSKPDLDRAWIKAGGEQENVAETLWSAAYNLEDAAALVPMYLDSDDVRAAVERCMFFMAQIATHFPNLPADRPSDEH